MVTSTYVPLATLTLASTDSEVVFSSIPATYRDLILVVNGRVVDYDWLTLQFNGDTGSNYSYVFMLGGGSGSGSSGAATTTRAWFGRFSSGAGQTSTGIAQIMDYSATDKHKTVLGRGNSPDDLVTAIASRWANTNAINQVKVIAAGAVNFTIGSTFSLYGVN